MAGKEKLIAKLCKEPKPKNFTINELDRLMNQSECVREEGSGSRIKYYHEKTKKVMHLHKPHPNKELKPYIIDRVKLFLTEIGELNDEY